MIIRRGALTGITMRGGLGTLTRFAVDWERIETVITPGDTEEQTIDDAVFEVTTPATVDYEAQAIIRPTHPDADVSQITWSTSDESIATIDASGKVTRVSDGYIRIIATDQHGATARSGLVHIYRQSGVESQTFVRWADGSLAKAIADAIDEAIETGDPAAIMPMYTSGNTRNPNCWAAELADLSCIDRNKPNAAFIGTSGGYSYAIQAGHYPDGTDTYVAMDGTVASVTVADSRRVGPTVPGYGPEIKIVRYSTALDAKFVPALLPPANLNDYFRHLSIGVPLICTDQEKKALVADLNSLGTWATAKVPTDSRRLTFYESAITGDSGSPRFVPIDGRLMLITALTYGGAGSGPNYSQYLSEILDAIDDMGGDVEDFEIADLSGWTNFADPIGAMIADYASAGMEHLYLFNTPPVANATIADHIGGGVGSRPGTLIAAWDGSLPTGGRTREGGVLTGMYFNESTTRPNSGDLGHNIYYGAPASGWPLASPTTALTAIAWITYYDQLSQDVLIDYRGYGAGATLNGFALGVQRSELCDGITLWRTAAQSLPASGTLLMVAATWSLASQTLTHYLNGVPVASTTTAASGPITLRNGRLFHRQVSGYSWPRVDAWLVATADVALSDAAIAALYERGLP